MSFSEERQVFMQELAIQMKVQKDGACPNKRMFVSLLDSHKKTGQAVRHNRLICISHGAPGRSRTSDRLVRSQVLYPAELRVQDSWKAEI